MSEDRTQRTVLWERGAAMYESEVSTAAVRVIARCFFFFWPLTRAVLGVNFKFWLFSR